MKKILLFGCIMVFAVAISAQCGSNSRKSNYKKTTTTTERKKKASTTTYIYSYQKGSSNKQASTRASSRSSCSKQKKSTCSSSCSSQKSNHKTRNYRKQDRLMLTLGGGATYTLDPDPTQGGVPKGDEFGQNIDWNPELLQPLGNAFIGYRFNLKNHKRADVLGVWATAGSHNGMTLTRLFARQELTDGVNGVQGNQFFTEVEGGLLLREIIRLSGGQGSQNYINLSGEQMQVNYHVATAGLQIPLGRNIVWNTNVSMLFGQDFSQYTLRPMTGIAFKFNTLRF